MKQKGWECVYRYSVARKAPAKCGACAETSRLVPYSQYYIIFLSQI
jgi:hypothetical protein